MKDTIGGKTVIRLGPDAHRVNEEALRELSQFKDIYQRGGVLVRIGERGAKGERRAVPLQISQPVLMSMLSQVAYFRGDRGHELPPPWVVAYIHSSGFWEDIRELKAVIEYPVLTPSGRVLQRSGYDEETGLYYAPKISFAEVPDRPTWNDVVAARERLLDLVCDFPFSESFHRSAWLAGLLTFFARPAYDGSTPFFLVDANTRGAGKGFLCHVAALVALGTKMPVATQPSDEAEDGKMITSICRKGDVVKLIDNISRPFGSGKFDAALTTTVWEDRVLGVSELVSLPHFCIWWGTGNNVQFNARADTARRTLHMRLLSMEQNPEARSEFKHPNLKAHILAKRGLLVADCLTILRAWHLEREQGAAAPKPWGSFEEWSEVVRGAVVFAGLEDPIHAHESLAQLADTSANSLGDLIAGWAEICEAHKVEACTVRQALDWLCEDNEYKARSAGHELRFLQLRDALSELCSTGGRPLPDAKQLGYTLRSFRGRVIKDRYLETTGQRGMEGKQWAVKGKR